MSDDANGLRVCKHVHLDAHTYGVELRSERTGFRSVLEPNIARSVSQFRPS